MATLLKLWFYTEAPRSSSKFTSMPSDHRKVPGKNSILAIRPLGMGRLRLRPNSGDRRRWGVGEKVGEVCDLTKGPFMAGVGAEGQLAAVLVDARRRRPWWPRLRRGEGTVGAKGGRGSFGRRSWSRGRA
jgi:hypothetical protein